MNTQQLLAFKKSGQSLLAAFLRDDNVREGLLVIERGDYFKIVDANNYMSNALNLRFDASGRAVNGGDDFLMYVPWAQRRDVYDYLDNLEEGDSINVEHSLVGGTALLQECKCTFYAFPNEMGSKTFLGVYSLDVDFDILEGNAKDSTPVMKEVQVQTSGRFELYVNNTPIDFRNLKARDLLALIVEKRGEILTSEEAIHGLWPGEPVNATTQARYRKVVSRLEAELKSIGVEAILRKERGNRRLETNMVKYMQ